MSGHVASQTRNLPLNQGIRTTVTPSGCFPELSDRLPPLHMVNVHFEDRRPETTCFCSECC